MAMKEEVLRQLVDELLSSADESSPIGHGVSRDDLDLNKQLIELVVNAGLIVLTQRPITDESLGQATRFLAAIRITVRKDPEVLMLPYRETSFVDWMVGKMGYLLCHGKCQGMRREVINSLANVIVMWRDGLPRTWHELRKCIEGIKSQISLIILDLGKEAVMKMASSDAFQIVLPTKDASNLPITDPARAFTMAFSLLHLLALTCDPRDAQWLVASLTQLSGLFTKWMWCEAIQKSKKEIEMAKLDAGSVLLQCGLGSNRQRTGVLKMMLQWTKECAAEDISQEKRSSFETAVHSLVAIADNESVRRIIADSHLPEILERIPKPIQTQLSADCRRHVSLILQFAAKPVATQTGVVNERPPLKRRQTDNPITIDTLFRYLLDSVGIPQSASQDHAAQLECIISQNWSDFNDIQRSTVTEGIGFLGCAGAGKLKLHTDENSSGSKFKCSVCDGNEVTAPKGQGFAIDLRGSLQAILQKKSSAAITIAAVRSFSRLISHDISPNLLSLSRSLLADAMLGLLSSENRDIRIATIHILPLLAIDRDLEQLNDIIPENRQTIFRHLRKIQSSSTREKPLLETTVMAYSEIGKVVTLSDLNRVLSNLVDFLGHNNSFIAALAYREILAVAAAHGQSTWQIFSPFWPSISIKVIEQMRSRPQILQRLADILEIRDAAFLIRTQNFTVPFLVLGRHNQVLEDMSLRMGLRVWEMLKENMPYILAGLFTQDRQKMESGISFLVNLMSAKSTNDTNKPIIDTRSLIFSSRTPLTIELLKMLATESDAKREKVFHALQTVAAYVSEKPITDAKGVKAQDLLKLYLQNNILELMNHFTDIITDKKGRKTFTEKIGCIAGIQEIIRFAASASKSALPQIIACFQTALMDDPLRWSAIEAWGTLVESVHSGEVATMLAHLLAVFTQTWPLCSTREKDLIKMVIQDAITRHEEVVMTDYTMPTLSYIPELESIAKRLDSWRDKAAPRFLLEILIRRCSHETAVICNRGLLELRDFLVKQESFIHGLIMGETCDKLVTQLLRCLLDLTAKYHDTDSEIIGLAVECLGIVGAVDPSRTHAAKEIVDMTLRHNFLDAEESVAFAMALIEQQLIGCFRAATDTKAQGYLAWAMQELLVFCGLTSQLLDTSKGLGADQLMLRKWGRFSKAARETLAPLLTSKYSIVGEPPAVETSYPIFANQKTYRDWLQTFTLATMNEAQGDNARKIFTKICSRIIKDQDLGIANFVLPYVVLNVIISGTDHHRENIRQEFLAVLESSGNATTDQGAAKSRLANQSVFLFVDYLQKWLRLHRKLSIERKQMMAKKANRYVTVDEDDEVDPATSRVEGVLSALPPDLMASTSFQCGSYARALFHWEQYIRDREKSPPEEGMDSLYTRWQEIYTHLDEPDGIEGISAKFTFQTFDQQITEHETAGHWSAAQSCYELALQQNPADLTYQKGFLNCIKQSGHHETYLSQISGLIASFPENLETYSTLAIESSWMAGNWGLLAKHLENSSKSGFECQVGEALLALLNGNDAQFRMSISNLQTTLSHAIVAAGTDSSRQCYDALARLHAVQELKAIRTHMRGENVERRAFMSLLDERLKFMIPTARYQQFALALRRAAISLSTVAPLDREIASSWLASAKVARKAGQFDEAYSAILRASELDLQMARLEHARWWWYQGQSRKAIECLQNSFAANIFEFNRDATSAASSHLSLDEVASNSHNIMLGKAMALLAKWLDSAKQTSEEDLLNRYKKVQSICEKWEKSHYLLGHYYNRLLEHEESKPHTRQKDTYIQGELTRLVCTCYLRSLSYGNKYIYETLPRVLTLWLDFGATVNIVVATKEDRARVGALRQQKLQYINEHVEKSLKKLPVYIFLPALAQLISRVMHPNEIVYRILLKMIVTIICEYPEHTMWSLIAVIKSNNLNRAYRGQEILAKLKPTPRRTREEMARIGQQTVRFAEALLKLCNFEITGRQTTVSLSKGLGFPTHSVLPCPLVVPLQSNLTVNLPSTTGQKGKKHNPFPLDQPTLQTFEDEVDIMNSMQKPRKITVRGSDGVRYPFLVKPKDDLRKDARLMEFNSIINKLLKKNPESSRRQLYIRTYSVVPLNEEHGIVEWVPHTRVLRDIILRYLRQKGIQYNYSEIKAILDSQSTDPSPAELFTTELLPKYPPVLWEWFVEEFAGPTAWLESRMKFSRTLAVMSFVGYVLGLGDRHSENILLDATTGAVVHVDFNCLFEKGQSFEKPEKVPFRLTQNLVNAMGPTGYDGVFRKAGEVTMRLLRANSDTLMSVLESFIHDPLVEWNRKKKNEKAGVDSENEEARKALMTIRGKLGGQINKEELPLSAEGQVDELIRMAVSPARLVAMYVGWAAFM